MHRLCEGAFQVARVFGYPGTRTFKSMRRAASSNQFSGMTPLHLTSTPIPRNSCLASSHSPRVETFHWVHMVCLLRGGRHIDRAQRRRPVWQGIATAMLLNEGTGECRLYFCLARLCTPLYWTSHALLVVSYVPITSHY